MPEEQDKKRLQEKLTESGFKVMQDLVFNAKLKAFEGIVEDIKGRRLKVAISGLLGQEMAEFTFLSVDLAGKKFSVSAPEMNSMRMTQAGGADSEVIHKRQQQIHGFGVKKREKKGEDIKEIQRRRDEEFLGQVHGPRKPSMPKGGTLPRDMKLREQPQFSKEKKKQRETGGTGGETETQGQSQTQERKKEETMQSRKEEMMKRKKMAQDAGFADPTPGAKNEPAKGSNIAKKALTGAVLGAGGITSLAGLYALLLR